MRSRTTLSVRLLGMVLLLGAILAAGCSGIGTRSAGVANDTGSSSMVAPSAPAPERAGKSVGSSQDLPYGAPQSVDGAGSTASGAQEPLVISTAGMNVEVKSLDAAVAAIRGLVSKYGATIANLSTNAGGEPLPVPQPLDGSSVQYMPPAPGGATITLRIPADKLAAAQKDIAGLGRVLSQSSSQDDVTQQHVDMKARLKNLQAEEARLRTFFLQAKKVSEMLAIEQELARVRGEIESMQAQITYLERQAAMATLTVSLSQPGALVSPAAGGWGFSAAVRDGVRAAAAVTRGLITTLLAFSPIIVLGLVLLVVIRALVIRRRNRRAAAAKQDVIAQDATAADPTQPPSEQ